MEKAAGTSVYKSLTTLFPEEQVCPDRFSSINMRDAEYLAPFRLFAAHATLADFANVPGRRFFITFLRDPVERMISAYRYWSSSRRDHIERGNLGLSRLCKDNSLPDFLSDEVLRSFPFLWNTYTQRLSGEAEIDPRTDFRARSQELLDRALAELDALDAVGIAEDVHLSFLVLSNRLGIANPYDGLRANVTAENRLRVPEEFEEPNPVEMNQETLDAIHRVTTLDQVIYNRAAVRLYGELHAGLSYDCHPASKAKSVYQDDEQWLHHDKNGALVLYGPYLKLPPATYWVTIAIRRARSLVQRPDDPVGQVEIRCDGGNQILRQRLLTNADIDREEGLVRIMLPLPHLVDNIEVRFVNRSSSPAQVRRRIEVALA